MKRSFAGVVLIMATAFLPSGCGSEEKGTLTGYEWRSVVSDRDAMIADLAPFSASGSDRVLADISAAVSGCRQTPAITPSTWSAAWEPYQSQVVNNQLSAGIVAGDPAWTGTCAQPAAQQMWSLIASLTQAPVSVEWDVEPWVTPAWDKDPDAGAVSWLDSVAAFVNNRTVGPQLGVTVPFWFDGSGRPATVEWKGVTATPLSHAVSILPEGSYVSIMAYRNSVEGPNGALALLSENMDILQQSQISAFVAVEVSDVPTPGVSYAGRSRADVDAHMRGIWDSYAPTGHLLGFAVNDLKSWVAMRP